MYKLTCTCTHILRAMRSTWKSPLPNMIRVHSRSGLLCSPRAEVPVAEPRPRTAAPVTYTGELSPISAQPSRSEYDLVMNNAHAHETGPAYEKAKVEAFIRKLAAAFGVMAPELSEGRAGYNRPQGREFVFLGFKTPDDHARFEALARPPRRPTPFARAGGIWRSASRVESVLAARSCQSSRSLSSPRLHKTSCMRAVCCPVLHLTADQLSPLAALCISEYHNQLMHI